MKKSNSQNKLLSVILGLSLPLYLLFSPKQALAQQASPSIQIDDFRLQEKVGKGDQDQIPDSAETIELVLDLKNIGSDANFVSATLFTASSYIKSISNNYSTFGDILTNQISNNSSNPFIFEIGNIPFGSETTVDFSLTINAVGYTQTINFQVPLGVRRIAKSIFIYEPDISGNKIVWEDWRYGALPNYYIPDIFLYDLDTNTKQQITNDTATQGSPAISGNKIVWEDYRNTNDDIYLYDLDTNTERQITSDASDQWFPSISGNKIVWEDWRNNNNYYNMDTYLYDLDTNTERQITTDTLPDVDPAIYNNKIVYIRSGINFQGPPSSNLYLFDLDLNTEKQIISNSQFQSDLDISNNKIVYTGSIFFSPYSGTRHIYLYDLATNTEKQVTTDISSPYVSAPSISGNKIVWEDYRNGNYDIYLYDLDTEQEKQITAGELDERSPAISGNKIVWKADGFGPYEELYLTEILDSTIISAMQAGSRSYAMLNTQNGYITPIPPGTTYEGKYYKYNYESELWFSLPVKPGDVITEIGILGPIGTAGTQYKKATLYEKHPGWSGVTDLGISVQQNQGQPSQFKTISYTVKAGQMVVVKVNLYSSTDHLNNKFTGISYKVKPATATEETRFVSAMGFGSTYKTISIGQTYAFIHPDTSNHVGELWLSLPVKKGDIITEIGISGPIPTTATQYKKATIVEKHPGWYGGVEIASVQQNQGNYYIVWNNIADYTVPKNRAVLVRVDLFISAGLRSLDNAFTGFWYKVKPAAEASQLKFLSPMQSGSKEPYKVTFNNIVTQFGNSYAYAYPSTTNTIGTIWMQLPVKAGEIITDFGVSGIIQPTAKSYTKATIVEKDPSSNTGIELTDRIVQQNNGNYYFWIKDIPDYTVPSGKLVLVKVELYTESARVSDNAFTGIWWK